MNRELTQSLGLDLSKDPETEGFDLQAGQTWVYPTNYPIRDYQFNIVQKALLKNTLVSLPTGLGKTFIAAVVMYNFFRWYPMGKVVFMAPTRPLVKQQIDACYDIMAIPKEATAELTGTKLATSRGDVWKEKRVFFITPQILQNDLETLKELGAKIKCVVFDEAHRARGNHAYCEVIRKLVGRNKFFRVLALSATPGSTITDVSEVVENLLISHLEFRTEESLDVLPYVYKRNLTTVVVPLGDKLQKVREDYLQILEYYTKTLMDYKVIQGNCGNLTKGKIFMTMKEFQRNRTSNSPNYAEIMKSLNICITLYHAFELLTRHGLRSFLSFFTEHIDKPLLRGNHRLVQIVEDVRDYLGPEPNIELLPDGSYPDIPKTVKFGHPKFYKLRDILLSHFLEHDDSRVIVFFEYRNSVMEAYALLIQARPVLQPRIFLGQGHGVTQRQQLNVVKSFREGECNVLLSTCIGEEGLDVGNVDLIVCFDISNKSPIRMVQRMGRTGRKKEGHIIVLVTEGKEQQILKDCLIHKNNIAYHVLASNELARGLNTASPRLVPAHLSPKCEKIHITVKKATLHKNSTLKDMFRNASSSSSEPAYSPDLELIEIEEKIPAPRMLWNLDDFSSNGDFATSNIFTKKIEHQRSLQAVRQIGHSKDSEALVELLRLVDSKRFNIPVTQIGTTSQVAKLKQGDIKSMFFKLQTPPESLTQSQSSQPSKSTQPNIPEDNYPSESKELFIELSNYLSIQISNDGGGKKCRHCPDHFDCTTYNSNMPNVDISWIQIDDSIFNAITLDDIQSFTDTLEPKSVGFDLGDLASTQQNIFDDIKVTQLEEIARKSRGNVNITLEEIEDAIIESNEDAFGDRSCAYEAPKNLDLIISRYGASIIDEPESSDKLRLETKASEINEREILSFFKLASLSDLFEDDTAAGCSQETIIYSPDIIESSFVGKREEESIVTRKKSEEELQMSPVLGGRRRLKKIAAVNKDSGPNLRVLNVVTDIDTPSKFTMHTTKMSSTPVVVEGTRQNEGSPLEKQPTNSADVPNLLHEDSPKSIDIDDICDLSVFGISPVKTKVAFKNPISDTSPKKNIDIDDFCDLTSFGITAETTKGPTRESIEPVSTTLAPAARKCQTQSQMPITQLLNLINGDESNPNLTLAPKLSQKKPESSKLRSSQVSSPCRKPKKNLVELFNKISSNSDDEFEDKPSSQVFKRPRMMTPQTSRKNSARPAISNKRMKPKNPFVDDQAEVSEDDNVYVSEDEEEQERSAYDASFVTDETLHVDTQMHARYLQSVRSPGNRGQFKIPRKPKFNITNVFSQEVGYEDDTYLDDSFVVNDEGESMVHELSELEILELKLEERRKTKRKASEIEANPTKRRRIVQISDDSD